MAGVSEIVVGGSVLALAEGDITRFTADAIVNAANSRLAGGGGVDGAIHRAGGPSIMAELDRIRAEIGSCPTGDAVVTAAGDLPARWVIHAVGPVYRDGKQGEPELLAACYRRALELAAAHSARSISFPAISAGIYGYPVAEAARIAVSTVASGLRQGESSVERATFVLFGREVFDIFAAALDRQGRPSADG
ncbi:MAG: O-acetyl-ADP-ribose deacetylase [Acidobacteria bacterium]|nr:O-acetyl-ADP-ribose deacetylase [Acidobacteriota bacterium]